MKIFDCKIIREGTFVLFEEYDDAKSKREGLFQLIVFGVSLPSKYSTDRKTLKIKSDFEYDRNKWITDDKSKYELSINAE